MAFSDIFSPLADRHQKPHLIITLLFLYKISLLWSLTSYNFFCFIKIAIKLSNCASNNLATIISFNTSVDSNTKSSVKLISQRKSFLIIKTSSFLISPYVTNYLNLNAHPIDHKIHVPRLRHTRDCLCSPESLNAPRAYSFIRCNALTLAKLHTHNQKAHCIALSAMHHYYTTLVYHYYLFSVILVCLSTKISIHILHKILTINSNLIVRTKSTFIRRQYVWSVNIFLARRQLTRKCKHNNSINCGVLCSDIRLSRCIHLHRITHARSTMLLYDITNTRDCLCSPESLNAPRAYSFIRCNALTLAKLHTHNQKAHCIALSAMHHYYTTLVYHYYLFSVILVCLSTKISIHILHKILTINSNLIVRTKSTFIRRQYVWSVNIFLARRQLTRKCKHNNSINCGVLCSDIRLSRCIHLHRITHARSTMLLYDITKWIFSYKRGNGHHYFFFQDQLHAGGTYSKNVWLVDNFDLYKNSTNIIYCLDRG